ncbi:MAG: hypothetical protein IT158_31570 [Bryobacterales bacterium]|nr:hypothetical protein [Bryobacterales bacterium]
MADPNVRRAIIVVHGLGRNAPGYYQSMVNAANAAGALPETIIVAPHFLTEEDVAAHGLAGDVAFWTSGGWMQGDDSLSTDAHPRAWQTSSFEFIAAILRDLSDRTVFPNLRSVVLVGHSAGGQFVQRFAAVHAGIPPVARYVVANPSSYLYMDGKRIGFQPKPSFCSTYNQYKYGLEKRNRYMSIPHEDWLRERYGQAHVVYLLGGEDRNPNDEDLDKSCQAVVQGTHRLERGSFFYEYIGQFYGSEIYCRHHKVVVPGVGHSAGAMFNSPEGRQVIFSDLTAAALPSGAPESPAAVVSPGGHIHVFARGDDRNIWHSFWNGQVWSGWRDDLGAGAFTSGPAAMVSSDGAIHVFGRGDDRNIWHSFWNGKAWSGWRDDLGAGTLTSGPSAVASPGGHIHVFARGDDRRMWHSFWSGEAWSGWRDDLEAGTFTSGPAAVVSPDGAIHVFARGDDGNIWHSFYNGQLWSGWCPGLGVGTFTSGPGAVVSSGGDIHVFARGEDRGIWHSYFDGKLWSGWHADLAGGTFMSGAAVVATAVNTLHAFAQGDDRNIWHSFYNGQPWSGWQADLGKGTFQA